jgi:5-formyltetrahydrofolate cyclo-ligase
MKGKLRALSKTRRQEIEEKLTLNLLASSLWNEAKTIGITISQGVEWNTEAIIKNGWKEGKRMVIPKCLPKTSELVFYEFESYSELETTSLNLLEPVPEKTKKIEKEAIDLLIVPGLIFDKFGYRIGFGGGYYDRFLAHFSKETVSILSRNQLVASLPKEEFDIPVKHLLTEEGLVNGEHSPHS